MPRKPRAPYPIDRPRQYLLDLMAEHDMDQKALSAKLKVIAKRGNETYIHQFITYGKPRNLPEWAREALATVFKLNDPDVFRANYKPKTNRDELLSLLDRLPPVGQEGLLEMARAFVRTAADLVAGPPPPRRRVGGSGT